MPASIWKRNQSSVKIFYPRDGNVLTLQQKMGQCRGGSGLQKAERGPVTAKPFSTSGVMTLIRQTGIHTGARERLGLKREVSRRKSRQEDRWVRERMDSLSRTYRSIPTAGQNSQIWYLPVQLQPGGETEDRVSKPMVLCREVAQGKNEWALPTEDMCELPIPQNHDNPTSTLGQKQTLVFWDQHGDGSWSPPVFP